MHGVHSTDEAMILKWLFCTLIYTLEMKVSTAFVTVMNQVMSMQLNSYDNGCNILPSHFKSGPYV